MRRTSVAVILLLTMVAAAGIVLAIGARPPAEDQSKVFHRLVGGLGFGPTLDLSRCEFGFDPRLCPACSNDYGPIPGGMFFCPQHASSIFDYPPPRMEGE
jgi:hypothetical protein